MKKSILVAAVVLAAGIFTANAQDVKTGQTTVNINLHKFQTLAVNDKNVHIDFRSEDHYMNGAESAVQNNHLTVSSTGAFVVTATAVNPADLNGKSLGGSAAPLNITTTQSGTNPLDTDAVYVSNTALETGTAIVSSTKGQFGKNVDVQYLANSTTYTNMGLIDGKFVTDDENTNTYKVQVTYTISVK